MPHALCFYSSPSSNQTPGCVRSGRPFCLRPNQRILSGRPREGPSLPISQHMQAADVRAPLGLAALENQQEEREGGATGPAGRVVRGKCSHPRPHGCLQQQARQTIGTRRRAAPWRA